MNREELLTAIGTAVMESQNATDEVDEAAAAVLGVNRTDLRCLGLLFVRDGLTAGELSALLHLSPGATTTLVDRLARAGLVTRERDDVDRRRVVVTLTDEARRRGGKLYGPIGDEGRAWLTGYSDDQLRVVLEYLTRGRELQERHARRIRDMRSSGPPE